MVAKADRRVLVRAQLLRGQKLTVDQIVAKLNQQFGAEAVPDRSTIARWLKRFESAPPEELSQDVPFAWGSMSGVPWEGSRSILELWDYHVTESSDAEHFGPFTFRVAKWCWRILLALDLGERREDFGGFSDEDKTFGPTRQDIIALAREYSWRETASALFEEPFDTSLLDLMLAMMSWRDSDSLGRYQKARDRLGSNVYMSWHYYDVEFLDRVDPAAAQTVGRRSSNLFEKLMRLEYESPVAADLPAGLAYRRAIDGLLPMQHNHYVKWWDGWKAKGGKPPWYIEHISDAWSTLSAEHPELRDMHEVLKGGSK